jgi:hypothetical protein
MFHIHMISHKTGEICFSLHKTNMWNIISPTHSQPQKGYIKNFLSSDLIFSKASKSYLNRLFLPQCENSFSSNKARRRRHFDCLFNVDFHVYMLFTKFSIFYIIQACFCVFLSSCSFGRERVKRTLCIEKRQKNIGYLFSKSVGVYFSL